jgi:hypothetical protein
LPANPEPATVTGVRRARGFVYLNLNGGDSWGYYFPESNAEIVRSFKGDPPVRLSDIAPGLWERVPPRVLSRVTATDGVYRWNDPAG